MRKVEDDTRTEGVPAILEPVGSGAQPNGTGSPSGKPPSAKTGWNAGGVIRPNPLTGVTILPAEWHCPEDDGIYDDCIPPGPLERPDTGAYPLRTSEPVVIAGFAGVGKTSAARALGECAIDFTAAPYKYLLDGKPPAPEEREALKATYGVGDMNPEWPGNYAEKLVELYTSRRYRYILIPPEPHALRALELNSIPCVLVYPRRDLREEYLQRFTERGNGEEFIDVFIGRWDEWMDALRSRKPALAIELGPGENLLGAMGSLGLGAGAG